MKVSEDTAINIVGEVTEIDMTLCNKIVQAMVKIDRELKNRV